ncbi:hypothetical protein ABPG72_002032 [Tetrahymena utriculariae]
MSINKEEVKKQVEYYLSDKNLVQDEKFRTIIQEHPEGYLSFASVLNCNRIKKLGVTSFEQLATFLADSTLVEVNEAKDSVRRVGNKPILAKEAVNPTEAAEKEAREAEKKELINFYETFQPIIFSTACEQEGVANWRNITEALLKQHNVHAPYCRFGKLEGNFALNKDKTSQEVIDQLVQDGLQFGESKVTIKVSEGEVLSKFWELHGRHYNGVMELKKKEVNQTVKAKKDKKEKKQKREFDFGGEKYTDILTIKNLFKGILGRTANGQKIISPYHDMLKALLEYHNSKEAKLKDLDHFTVDVHPEHKDTRCFFVVKSDGTKEDFSAVKCISNLEQKLNL